MMMILMTSDDDKFDDIENDSDDIACNHDNEDMMMILMILHAIMIMKIMYEIQHTDFRIIFYHDCDRCLLARTDQQRGPSFDKGTCQALRLKARWFNGLEWWLARWLTVAVVCGELAAEMLSRPFASRAMG